MDLFKMFGTLDHELLISKLHTYGFSKEILILLLGYLSNRWQRTKMKSLFNYYRDLLQSVPQGSILGSLFLEKIFKRLIFLLVLKRLQCCR